VEVFVIANGQEFYTATIREKRENNCKLRWSEMERRVVLLRSFEHFSSPVVRRGSTCSAIEKERERKRQKTN